MCSTGVEGAWSRMGLPHIYVDADACPVKKEVYKVAQRYGMHVTLVANSWMRVPMDARTTLEVVGDALDEADDWIVEHVGHNDIVITADILLAGRCLEKGARVIGNTGKVFDEANIGIAVATRELMADLREAGEMTGGPPPMGKKDRSRFLQVLDQAIQAVKREG